MTDASSTQPMAIIPARGGSKGIHRKNLANVAGSCLVAHSIAAAQSSCCCRIVVSTDDDDIASIASECGASIVYRPPVLATDWAATDDVLLHAIWECRASPEQWIVCLQPTSPLRPRGIIERCIAAAEDVGADCAYTVHAEHGLPVGSYDPRYRPRRQDLTGPLLIENGSVYVVRASMLYAGHPRICGRSVTVEIDSAFGTQIDDDSDLRRVNALWGSYDGR